MSLMDQLTKVVTAQIAGQASQKTGVDNQMAAQLAPMAITVLMNGLKNNAANPNGAQALSQALDSHDGSLLDNLSRVSDDTVMNDGQKILGHILGNKQQGAERALADAAGVNQNQVGAILAMVAPTILAGLGKAKREQGLDVSALTNLVSQEGARARQAAPAELGGVLGMLDSDGDGNVTEEIVGLGAKMLGGLFNKNR